MTLKFLTVSVLAISVTLTSCKESTETSKGETSEEVADTLNNTPAVAEKEQEVSYNLPSALQIAYVFKKSGAGFDATLPNNKANVSKYNTSHYKSAVNFGIYSADLSYCLFNKKYPESKDYLKACKETGSLLGLNQAFESGDLANRFDKNITNEDSVVKIVSNVQLKTDVMFEQNKQKHIAVIAFAGAWTESTYIASQVYLKEKNKKVLASLLEELLLATPIIKALKSHESSEPEITSLLSSIEKINSEFNAIAAVKTALEKDEEMDLTTMAVTDAEIKTISESVKALRTSMVD